MQNSIYKIKYLLFLSWDWEAWCLTVWRVIPPPSERNTAWNKGRKCFQCLGAPNNLIRPWCCCVMCKDDSEGSSCCKTANSGWWRHWQLACFVTDRNLTRRAKKLNMAADFWCTFKWRRVYCILIWHAICSIHIAFQRLQTKIFENRYFEETSQASSIKLRYFRIRRKTCTTSGNSRVK